MKKNYIKTILSTKEGRAFLNDILGFCGIYQADAISLEDAFMKQGRKQVGLYIHTLIREEDRSLLYKMMDEAYNENKEKENEREEHNRTSRQEHDSGAEFDYRQYYELDGNTGESSGHDSGEGLNL